MTDILTGAVRVLVGRTVPWLAGAFAVIAALYGVIIVPVASWGTPGTSIWASSGWVLQWLAFAGGIALGSSLPVLIASGLTRRTVALAGGAALLLVAAGMAVLVQAGLVAEGALFAAADRPYRVDGDHLFTGIGQVHLVVAEFGTMFAAFLASGWLVWTGYYRWGWWRGTLALPLAFLPAAGALAALSAGYVGQVDEDSPPWVATLGLPAAVASALVAVAAGLLGIRVLTRTLAVK